jgi:nitronate monooxygenase
MLEKYRLLAQKFNIHESIFLAPMDLVSGGALASAVSAAGGLGLIGGGYGNESWLNGEFEAAAGAHVGVGFITWSLTRNPRLLDVALEHKPAAVMLSFGDAAPHLEKIKRAGIFSICQVQTAAMAREAVQHGADVVVAQGAEAGGHGVACGSMSLIPTVVDAVGDKAPVIAAGGIADARGVVAALALGASGVLMGTRFYATEEAIAHSDAKRRIVEARGGEATVRGIVCDIARNNVWPAPFTGRVLRNEFLDQWAGRERELMQLHTTEGKRYADARFSNDFDTAAVIAGEACGLIGQVMPAAEVVRTIVDDMTRILGLTPRHCGRTSAEEATV